MFSQKISTINSYIVKNFNFKKGKGIESDNYGNKLEVKKHGNKSENGNKLKI